MKSLSTYLVSILCYTIVCSQDNYDLARANYSEKEIDSARYFINKCLAQKPTAEEYFLSAMIHEA
ncbi:MAG: hypothetical protein RLP12_02215, partial [Ekhidna sp.]